MTMLFFLARFLFYVNVVTKIIIVDSDGSARTAVGMQPPAINSFVHLKCI